MIVTGQLKEVDYVAAQFLHLRPRPVFAVIGLILLCLAICAIVYVHSFWFLFGLIYLVVFFAVIIPFKAKRTFRQYKVMSEPVTMEVLEGGLFFKRTNGEGLVPWSHIVKWKNNKKLAILYPAGNLFYMVPNHFFAGPVEFEAFVATLKERLGKAA